LDEKRLFGPYRLSPGRRSYGTDEHNVGVVQQRSGIVCDMSQKPGIARPLAAAQTVALANSVACEDAVVVAGGSNVLVHLAPAELAKEPN
jgi:hypothetical protein